MNISKFFAPDMRRAINQVREQHGPDAVILSSKSVEGGIEIIAAVDYDQNLIAQVLGSPQEVAAARADASESATARAEPVVPPIAAEKPVAEPREPKRALFEPRQAPVVPAAAAAPLLVAAPPPQLQTRNGTAEMEELLPAKELRAIQKDLYALKGLVRERFAWSDLRSMTPQRNWLMRRAEAFGLTPDLADTIVMEVEHPELEDRAWREVIFGLARRLTVMRDDPLEQGGIFAMVGPTGVGKTTTLAKLAARHCLQHGRESLGLITTDNFKLGAHRQLDAFGAMLGVPVRSADSPEKLAKLLDELSSRKLVLIDTSGVAPRDITLTESLLGLSKRSDIRRFLVLAANMQAAVMQDAVRGFGGKSLSGAVLTKIDETNGLGAAISVLIESKLPAVWMTDGQRVPQDLKLARVANLLKRATVLPEASDTTSVPAFHKGEDHAAA